MLLAAISVIFMGQPGSLVPRINSPMVIYDPQQGFVVGAE